MPKTTVFDQTCVIRVEFSSPMLTSGYWIKVDRYNPETGRASGGFKAVPFEQATRFRFEGDAVRYMEQMSVGDRESIYIRRVDG